MILCRGKLGSGLQDKESMNSCATCVVLGLACESALPKVAIEQPRRGLRSARATSSEAWHSERKLEQGGA